MMRHKEAGAALLMALAAVIIVSALGMSMATIVMCSIRSDRRSSARDSLMNAAEAGVAFAVWKLGDDPAWRGGAGVPVPGGKCDISVKAGRGGTCAITSRTSRGNRTCAVRVTVRRIADRGYRVVRWRLLPQGEPAE
jgi:Tfp pilus assembly protein PilX